MSSANSCVTGAPPTMICTSSRRSASMNASIVLPMLGMVVVSSADMPISGASFSSTASMNSSAEVSTPKSITSKPPRSSMMHRFLPMSCRSPLTVPITTVPCDGTPDSDRIGSMCAMPAFMARAHASTSGTKMMFSRNLMPTIPMPAIRPSSMISTAVMPPSSACLVSSSTSSSSPSMRAAEISCIAGRARANISIMRSRSSGRSMNSSISSRINSLSMSSICAMGGSVRSCGAC